MIRLRTTTPVLHFVRKKTSRSFSTWRSIIRSSRALLVHYPSTASRGASNRNLAQVRPEPLSELWFTASFPTKSDVAPQNASSEKVSHSIGPGSGDDHKPPDERTLKLGKTLRLLSPLLPTIFTAPLPHDVLSSALSLYLFPSTHPHLPVVKGRVPCRAALWTAPVAWGSVPIVGNVKIEVMSEKMIRTGFVSAPIPADDQADFGEEKLVVRWRSEGKKSEDGTAPPTAQSLSSSGNEINRGLSTLLGGSQPLFSKGPSEPFTGLFIFTFDKKGKIASLTIEHADESNGFDKTSKVVTLADWLLGKARWGRAEEGLIPGLACKEVWCKDHGFDRRYWGKKER